MFLFLIKRQAASYFNSFGTHHFHNTLEIIAFQKFYLIGQFLERFDDTCAAVDHYLSG